MTIVFAIVAGLGALILIVLFAPLRLTLEGAGGPSPERIEVQFWGWPVYLWRPGQNEERKVARPPKPSKPKRKARRGGVAIRDRVGPLLKLLAGLTGLRLARRMLRSASFPEGRLHIVFGADDPSLTGLVAGPAYAINAHWGGEHLDLEPDFTQPILAFEGRLALQTSLARLSGPPLRFLVEPGALPALWTLANGPAKPKPQPQTQTPR